MTNHFALPVLVFALTLGSSILGASAPAPQGTASAALIERGRYLVNFGGCHDCHTPWKVGPRGPEPDMARALTGHPEQMAVPPGPQLPPGPWMATVAATMTAWSGPWGTSFTANLTPDVETGLGEWTEENFIQTMRTGRRMGKGRPLLPPMPYPALASLNDHDLKAIFAYLRSLPPVRNRVPQPIDPPEEGAR